LSELAAVGSEFRQAEMLRLAPASIKNKLSYLRAACRYAQKEYGMGNVNLRLQVGMPTVKNARQRYLTRQQMLTICKMCTDRTARAVIRISFYIGMRISETILAGRHLRTIQSGEGFFLQDTKNGSMRIAAMHPKLRVLSKYFPLRWKKSWIRKLIRRAMNAAGFQEYVLHDIRPSTASALINAGVDLYTVGQMLGYKSLASTARYAHLDMRSKIDAINKIK
jgi:site-specific recombinase XerD